MLGLQCGGLRRWWDLQKVKPSGHGNAALGKDCLLGLEVERVLART